MPKEKIHMGFEPGTQANGGVWEGNKVDMQVIDMLQEQQYGGASFWTINDPAQGANSNKLASYAKA